MRQNNPTNVLFLYAIVNETNFVLVFLWSLTLTEGPRIYYKCGRAGSCSDQEVTGRRKSVLVLAVSVLYPSPGQLQPPRTARKIKRGVNLQRKKIKCDNHKGKENSTCTKTE